jgi:MFS family permease
MVFTHVLSNVLLASVAVMPTMRLAAAALLCRHLFAQMDVPTRQSYTTALVAPDERAPAAGLTVAVRGLAQSVSPVLTGIALAHAAFGLPFFLAGGLKIGLRPRALRPLPTRPAARCGRRAARALTLSARVP